MATTTATIAPTTSCAPRRVVLHFDLNRTVLMSDAAGGRTMENTVDYLLSECTWGYVHPDRPTEWICVSDASSIAPPTNGVTTIALDDDKNERVAVPLITYKQFVDHAHPYKSLESTTDSVEHVKAYNKAAKKQRTALQSAFTGANGPGARVRATFDDVLSKLHFPAGDTAAAAASRLPPSRVRDAWLQNQYYLLPSFLNLLEMLGKRYASGKDDVRIVFRTFGDDLVEVARELALFVDGTHPFTTFKLPAAFALDVSRESQCIGTFYRDGFDSNGTALAVGTLQKVPGRALEGHGKDILTFYADNSNVHVVRGFDAIDQTINQMLHEHVTIALRDYWEWWSAHAEHAAYGKLLLVNNTNPTIQMFLDDHIEATHAHIVDVRDVTTGHVVEFATCQDSRFVMRVEPFAAITDVNYFVDLVTPLLAEVEKETTKGESKM